MTAMVQLRRFIPGLICVGAAALAGAPPAFAHGAIRYEQEACVLKVGPDFMYFSGYRTDYPKEKFCEDVPELGQTVFTLDYAQDEMRAMTADLRIIRKVAEAEEQEKLDAVTVAYIAPKTYPSGTLTLEYDFKEAGDYVGIINMEGPNGEKWASRFPFAVGRVSTPRTPYYLITAALVLGLLLMFWDRDESKTRRGG